MKQLYILLAFVPMLSQADKKTVDVDSTGYGIYFEGGLNWQQVLTKAKAENKFIFVDCYTTWCGPCKKMEKDVYSIFKVGYFFNDKFISVKLQMDTSERDSDSIKASYPDARYIETHYKVPGYPTFLFFNPNGMIMSKSTGSQDVDGFMKLAYEVLDSKKDYYRLLENYKQGKRNLDEMSYLARISLQLLGDTALSEKISKSYILMLKKEAWFVKSNIEFIYGFTKSSMDKGFSLFYRYTDTINRVMADRDYSQKFVYSIIYREIVLPEIEKANKSNSSPDWNALSLIIKRKYGNYYGERVIIGAKLNWGRRNKNWSEYTKYFVLFVEKYNSLNGDIIPNGIEDLYWNNMAWEVFKYSNNKEELIKALNWSNHAVRMNPVANWMDTYANILYKLGYKDLAISWEYLATKQDPANEAIQIDLEKMKKNEPTWPL